MPAFKQDFAELFRLTKVGEGTRFIDLGCGDGKVLLAAAQKGAIVTGYEINPILWLIAWLRLLPYRKRATIKLGSYWSQNLAPYDVIWLYLIDRHMPRMARKIRNQAAAQSHIISYIFRFPGIKPTRKTRNSYIYRGTSFTSAPNQIQ